MKKLEYFLNSNAIVFCFTTLIILSLLSGCMYYFKLQSLNNVSSEELKEYNSSNKYFILHQGKYAWNLRNILVSDDYFSGNLRELPVEHLRYLTVDKSKKNRYKKNAPPYMSSMLNEVHIYYNDTLIKFDTGDSVIINFSSISKVEVYQEDKTATRTSWALPAVLIPVASTALVITIIALTKSSCPLVYIQNNNNFSFAGEIFGGAVYSSLERNDFLPLPGFIPKNNQFKLKITNGLPEIQYINLAELMIVDHSNNISVLPDRQGIIHTFKNIEPPAEALSSAKNDISEFIENKDQYSFLFDETPSATSDSSAFNEVYLTFSVPPEANSGKLIISAGNSVWGDYTYGEFTKLFGSKYGDWIKKQGKLPAEKNIQWMKDQCFVLMVYLETSSGWQFVDYFDLIGPLGSRDMTMLLDISKSLHGDVSNKDRNIKIMLKSGFKLWELDYAGMDFSEDTSFIVNYVKPYSAITESEKEVKMDLIENDSQYYIQKNIGEEALLSFINTSEIKDMKKSVFIHTKGYYEHIRNYPGPPQKEKLLTFMVPGRFSKFSFDNYTEFVDKNYVFASDQNLP